MRAVLLAAGIGTRISRHIDHRPKCTVPISDELTLIEFTVSTLRKLGVSDILAVVGYRSDAVKRSLSDDAVEFVENPFYDVTNSIASLYLARDWLMGDDLLLMNADTFLEAPILERLLHDGRSPVMLVDSSRAYDEMDYKVRCERSLLRAHGKTLGREDTTAEYAGAARLARHDVGNFVATLESMIREQKHDRWWENVLYEFCEMGEPVHTLDVRGRFWAEIDYYDDYVRVLEHVARG